MEKSLARERRLNVVVCYYCGLEYKPYKAVGADQVKDKSAPLSVVIPTGEEKKHVSQHYLISSLLSANFLQPNAYACV